MVLDVIILIIIVFTAVRYSYRGFALTVIRAGQWLATLLCAVLFTGDLRRYIDQHTPVGSVLRDMVSTHISDRVKESGAYQEIPRALQGLVSTGADAVSGKLASEIAGILLSVLAFLLIALAIKLICWGVAALFSKKHHHGAIGTLDTAAEFLLGFGLGIFYALLLLALLALLISVCSPGTASSLSALMKGSYISENLYRMNPLLSAFRSVLG